MANKNLLTAQHLFVDICNGQVHDADMERHVERLRMKFEQVRSNGQPTLGLEALDSTGKKTAQEVEAIINDATQEANMRINIMAAASHLDSLKLFLENTIPNANRPWVIPQQTGHYINQIQQRLIQAGVETDIFQKDGPPTIEEMEAVLRPQLELIRQRAAQLLKTKRSLSADIN